MLMQDDSSKVVRKTKNKVRAIHVSKQFIQRPTIANLEL